MFGSALRNYLIMSSLESPCLASTVPRCVTPTQFINHAWLRDSSSDRWIEGFISASVLHRPQLLYFELRRAYDESDRRSTRVPRKSTTNLVTIVTRKSLHISSRSLFHQQHGVWCQNEIIGPNYIVAVAALRK